jgi:uncharacterized membrane protein
MKRFWEVDFIRGIAIALMIVFNYAFALSFLGLASVGGGFLFWYVFPRLVAGTFISISGLSMTLCFNHSKNKRKIAIRGLEIFGLGMAITLVTFLTFPEEFVIFGILHMIGLAMIIGIPFLRFKRLNLIMGFALIALGLLLEGFRFDFGWLLWLGLIPANFMTFDFFPLLPWFGVTLIGIYAGNRIYRNGERKFKITDRTGNVLVRVVTFLGRNSLVIYLAHQPLLVFVLMLLGYGVL